MDSMECFAEKTGFRVVYLHENLTIHTLPAKM
jgi:hypothetical protein